MTATLGDAYERLHATGPESGGNHGLMAAGGESEPAVADLGHWAVPIAGQLRRLGEHGIKFSDTAVDVYERTGNPDALAAAAHVRELIR